MFNNLANFGSFPKIEQHQRYNLHPIQRFKARIQPGITISWNSMRSVLFHFLLQPEGFASARGAKEDHVSW